MKTDKAKKINQKAVFLFLSGLLVFAASQESTAQEWRWLRIIWAARL